MADAGFRPNGSAPTPTQVAVAIAEFHLCRQGSQAAWEKLDGRLEGIETTLADIRADTARREIERATREADRKGAARVWIAIGVAIGAVILEIINSLPHWIALWKGLSL